VQAKQSKALSVSWQLHMTNNKLYGKIRFPMDQLQERCLTFAGHCYWCEDQLVEHLVLLEGKTDICFVDKAIDLHMSNDCCIIHVAR